jgi:hypothetical protein
MWFSLAAAQKQEDAPKYRNFLASRMTSGEISKAEQLAAEWLERHQQ